MAEYTDKRKKAQADPKKARGQLVHADEHSTTVADHKGELKESPHSGEMTRAQIHAHLNKPFPVNADLAHEVVKHKLGIGDHSQFLKDAVAEESYKTKPRFTDAKGAADWFQQTHTAPKLKELRAALGKTTSRAKAYMANHKDYREMADAHAAGDGNASAHQQAEGQMLGESAESAHAEAELAMEQGEAAQSKGPKDAPKIDGLAPSVKFFGHQAQALAQMAACDSSICDVDMGGGKGLILPADALALMSQGKVKKPIIIVPAATLDQNAAKITDDYTGGKINVFKISSEAIAKHHGGDIASVVQAIKDAPPNTIFMATYDAIAHQDRTGAPERFPHAAALAAAGFDYMACDECHNVRNEDSARFQALAHLGGARFKRMASGTFLANDPRDVVGPIKLLFPAMDLDQKKLEDFYGRKEDKAGATWSPEGLKKLRGALLKLGMVSLRRSAWMDKLPKRKDALSVVQMLPEQKRVHDAVLNDALQQLELEAKEDPLLAKALEDDSLDNAWEAPPQLMRKLEVLQGVTDYPDEMAKMLDANLQLAGKGSADPDSADAIEALKKFSPAARNAMLSLKGMVSPKALDVYKKAGDHLKDPKNGKFIVFVQRKAAARHIIDNMPAELKAQAQYFDASKMAELAGFTDKDDGPRLLVAVDASIKEGVNMQKANGLYRYDHHLTPGNQEQSYARIWRFGQDKPTSIHLGIMDGGMDVTKYARLCSKGSVNQQVVSDYDGGGKKTPIYKLSLKNLKDKRDASILNSYQQQVEDVLDWQKGENKKYKAAYGEQPYDLATGKDIPKGKAMHGQGSYHQAKIKKAEQIHLPTDYQLADNQPTLLAKAAAKLWAYRQPPHIGSEHDQIGEKITNLPKGKLAGIQRIIQAGIRGKESQELIARRLRHSVNSAGHKGDDRDWQMVAQTEISNARAHGALEHILQQHGPDTMVQRQTNGCCAKCCHAFGKYVRRKWRAGSIPDKFKGAVHPRCKCGPWQLINPAKRLMMRKAASQSWGIGLVMLKHGQAMISTGYGNTWAPMDSITGHAIMRAVLTRCPLVMIEPSGRSTLCRVGHGLPKGTMVLLDPLQARGARYYPMRPDAEARPSKYAELSAKTREDYIGAMMQVLPVVATMPEYWQPSGPALRPLTDLLGYKTLTDWWVMMPRDQAPEAIIAAEPAGALPVRDLVRRFNAKMIAADKLAKGWPDAIN